jgi:hypothetical protein
MADASAAVLLDDRLLIEHLLMGLDLSGEIYTTSYWYYRASRAAVAGAGGHLSGPFEQLDASHQAAAIRSLLDLPDQVQLPDPRKTVPKMAELSERHPRLNLLNLEAVAAAVILGATALLSAPTAEGVLPGVLDAERVAWRVVDLEPPTNG